MTNYNVSLKEAYRNEGLLRISEVAELLGVSPDTVARWSNKGRMPAGFKIGGTGWTYWYAAEITAWLAARCPSSPQQPQDDNPAVQQPPAPAIAS